MKSPLDLSFRYKMPLWGGILIVVTALAVAAALMKGEYDEQREDLANDASILGDSVRTAVTAAMLQDDVWAAFQAIGAPVSSQERNASEAIHPDGMFIMDKSSRVFVSTAPKVLPLGTDLRRAGPPYAALATRIGGGSPHGDPAIEVPGSDDIFFASPIKHRGEVIGTLVISYPSREFSVRFSHFALDGLLAGGFVLAILLPISWYFGQRMARPLVEVAQCMEQIGKEWPPNFEIHRYSHQDELGRLFGVYNDMLRDLKTKAMLEAEMVRSERLSAVGRLAAGVAHEINNPLSGMLTAIDTLRHHGDVSPMTMKTLGLIERGLNQIKDIVAALLVQAKMTGRNLTPDDVEDVHTLIKAQARKKHLRIEWNNRLPPDVPLPATLIRQVLINLLLNAIQATPEEGDITMDIHTIDDLLELSVANTGPALSADERAHIFEPFSPVSKEGHGLGLWVTYQIVQQLNGEIRLSSAGERTVFSLTTPIKGIG